MPRAVNAYVMVLAAAAGYLLLRTGNAIGREAWPFLIGLSVLTVYFTLHPVSIGRGQPAFSFVSAILLLAMVVAGTPIAVWVAALGSAAETLLHGWDVRRTAYNASQSVIAVFASGMVFAWVGGQSGPAYEQPVAALAAALVYHLVNAVLISQLFAFLRRQSFWHVFKRQMPAAGMMTYSMGQFIAVMGATLAVRNPVIGIGLVFALLVLIQRSFKDYLDQANRATERGQELEAVLNATQSAILVRNQEGMVKHANKQFLHLTGTEMFADRMVGRPYPELHVLGRVADLLQAVAAAAGDGEATSRAVLPVELDEVRYVDYYRGPVTSADEGGALGTIEVFTDVTPVKEAEEKLRAAHSAMLRAMTAAIDARDPYTHGHSARVAEYSVLIAQELGLPEADVQRIHYSGLLHDIGKIGVDDRVLRKTGPLTPEERAAMMEHPVIGVQLLEKAGVFLECLPGVRHHHEWWNGGGYPDGLKAQQIPFDARIIGVADAFDAMTSDRPYRPALSPQEALTRLQSGKNIQFDAQVVDAFTRLYSTGLIQHTHQVETVRIRTFAGGEMASATSGMIRPVHKKEMSVLYRVARENYAHMDLSSILRRILEICHDTIAPHNYLIFLKEEQSAQLVLAASIGEGNRPGVRLNPDESLVGRVAATGKSVLVPEATAHKAMPGILASTRSACAVPLLYGGETIGVFAVESPISGTYTRDDLYLFEALAQQVASTVELARQHERLRRADTHDALTGALNYSAFYGRLTEVLDEAEEKGHEVAVALLDLSGLKAINARYGHAAGDQALREWAGLLREQVRGQDLVARYGGDEFGVILPHTGRRQAAVVLARIARAAARSFESGGQVIPLPPVSVGIACFPEDGQCASDLVARADHLMYEEKSRQAERAVAGGRKLGTHSVGLFFDRGRR